MFPFVWHASSEQLSGKFPLKYDVSTSTRTNLSRLAELDDRPIVTWTTAPLCFPAVAHVRRSSGHDQVVTMTKEHVAAREHQAAVFDRREIDLATSAFESVPIGHDFAVDAQSRDTTVRIDLETKMCEPVLQSRSQKDSGESPFKVALRQNLSPLNFVTGQVALRLADRQTCNLRANSAQDSCRGSDWCRLRCRE